MSAERPEKCLSEHHTTSVWNNQSQAAHPVRLESVQPTITLQSVHQIAENLWLLRYPLRLLGTEIGRTVTLIRLHTGELVIHSPAPFSTSDASAVKALGR